MSDEEKLREDVTSTLRQLVSRDGLLQVAILIKQKNTTNLERWIKPGNLVPATLVPYIADVISEHLEGDQ